MSERTNNKTQGDDSPIYKYNNTRIDKDGKESKNLKNFH